MRISPTFNRYEKVEHLIRIKIHTLMVCLDEAIQEGDSFIWRI